MWVCSTYTTWSTVSKWLIVICGSILCGSILLSAGIFQNDFHANLVALFRCFFHFFFQIRFSSDWLIHSAGVRRTSNSKIIETFDMQINDYNKHDLYRDAYSLSNTFAWTFLFDTFVFLCFFASYVINCKWSKLATWRHIHISICWKHIMRKSWYTLLSIRSDLNVNFKAWF